MTTTAKSIDLLKDQDEDVRMAVRVLGDMRNSKCTAFNDSASSTSVLDNNPPNEAGPSTLTASESQHSSPTPASEGTTPTDFVSRVSYLPIVNTAMRVYESGKANSRVVKFGAQMVESSISSISARLPVGGTQTLDEFGCRQLDRLDRYRKPATDVETAPPVEKETANSMTPADLATLRGQLDNWDGRSFKDVQFGPSGEVLGRYPAGSSNSGNSKQTRRGRDIDNWVQANAIRTDSDSSTSTPQPDEEDGQNTDEQAQNQIVSRSRWQTVGQAVLLEAGGLSAAVSEESMRRLKYCLHWLQYATTQIDAQILILRDFISALQPLPSSPDAPMSQADIRTLATVKKDLIKTIRQVVDVVGKYAGGALPEPARNRVRGFVLGLPERWAATAGGPNGIHNNNNPIVEGETRSVVAAASGVSSRRGTRRAHAKERGAGSSPSHSRAPSPSRHMRTHSHGQHPHRAGMNAGTAVIAAQKVLGLATESLDMMRSVTGVVKDSLDRADAWVGRLRAVGLQRASQNLAGDENGTDSTPGQSSPDNDNAQYDNYRPASDDDYDDSSIPSTPYGSISVPSTPYLKSTSVPSTPMPMPAVYDQLGALSVKGNSQKENLGPGSNGDMDVDLETL